MCESFGNIYIFFSFFLVFLYANFPPKTFRINIQIKQKNSIVIFFILYFLSLTFDDRCRKRVSEKTRIFLRSHGMYHLSFDRYSSSTNKQASRRHKKTLSYFMGFQVGLLSHSLSVCVCLFIFRLIHQFSIAFDRLFTRIIL